MVQRPKRQMQFWKKRGIPVIPDIFAKWWRCCCFLFRVGTDYCRNLPRERDRVNETLENLMSKWFAEITEAKEKYGCTYRMAGLCG